MDIYLQKLLAHTISDTEINSVLKSASRIVSYTLSNQLNIKKITIPNSIKRIDPYAFKGTPLTSVTSDEMDPLCEVYPFAFEETSAFITNATLPLLFADGKIAFRINWLDGIPDSVINLAGQSIRFNNASPSGVEKFVIGNNVQVIQSEPFVFTSGISVTTVDVGENVRQIKGRFIIDSGIKTLIFRQPEKMEIKLPKAGSSATGLAYNKSSRAINVYTDNLAIRAYDWAADNATVTFHPLSEAPA